MDPPAALLPLSESDRTLLPSGVMELEESEGGDELTGLEEGRTAEALTTGAVAVVKEGRAARAPFMAA